MSRNSVLTWRMLGLVAGAMISVGTLYAQTTSPEVGILASDATALEGTSSGAFTLIRYGATDSDLTVNVAISGTASNGVDYVQITNELTIAKGSLSLDVLVDPIVDLVKRGNKTVVLTIQTNSAYSIAYGLRKATVTIVDDTFNVPPPTVSLTSPTNGSVILGPTNVTLLADASDTGVPITSVSFYANDAFLGKVTTTPYSLVWTNPHSGHFTLFARAVNQVGQSSISAPVYITVTNERPSVVLTNPTNGMNFIAHSDITLAATATDPDNDVAQVAFYANGHQVGVVTNAPYSLVWSNAPAGFYYLYATATDQEGQKAYSSPVVINVSRGFVTPEHGNAVRPDRNF